ncbi:MAG: flagellar hook basal-body protein [Alphaproteobacteria bacterium]|jgi:flagellar hook protein FlgE|nr:flagellar hook basal-body protein [Alphaproteobacteria bacterium]MDG2465786.1 flagellar hook basal-body protein [Alphaproteobacteria bacterium]
MLSIISSGLLSANKEISTISNNISNANSTGYKRSTMEFQDIYAKTSDQIDNAITGMGARNSGMRVIHSQGSLETTGMTLDLGISGYGMFVGTDPVDGGRSYTRDGSFSLNEAGQMITNTGNILMSTTGEPITIPFRVMNNDTSGQYLDVNSILINARGEVSADYGTNVKLQLGQIGLARFRNVNGLTQRGLNEFEASNLSGLPTFGAPVDGVFGQIVQGSIEASNTDVSNEMVMMMRAQQAFGASSRLVQAEADIVSTFTKG